MNAPQIEDFKFRPHPNVKDAVIASLVLPNGHTASIISMLPWGVRSGAIDPAGRIQIGGNQSTYELSLGGNIHSWATEDEVNALIGTYILCH